MTKEDLNIEFKAIWKDDYLKTICAFANTEGGILKIGVDNNGNVLGLANIEKLLEKIPNKTNGKLGIIPNIKSETSNRKNIIIIEVKPSSSPISYNGKYYKRSGSNTFELRGEELTRFLIMKSSKGWDEYVEESASLKDLNFETIEHFKELSSKKSPVIKSEKDPKKLLEKLNLIDNNKIKRAAILLFAKNPRKYYSQAYLKIGRFKGETEITGSDDIEGNLFQQVEKAMEILKSKYLMTGYSIKGLYHNDVLEYPETALREAIINALIHREYLSSAHIQMRIYNDRMWLWNDGNLPEGITLDDLKKSHRSKPRNKLLADVFYKANLIEKWGSGTVRMIEVINNAGLPEPDFEEEQGGFAVYFYKNIYSREKLKKMGLDEKYINAVMFIKENGRITNTQYQEINHVSKRTASRDLSGLTEMGIFERIGTEGKGTHYLLVVPEPGQNWNVKVPKENDKTTKTGRKRAKKKR